MEIDKEKLLNNIKEALGEKGNLNEAIKSGKKDEILKALPTNTKDNLNELLKDPEKMKQLLNTKEAKTLISKFLKEK